jgi:hypothetical protein
MVLSAAKGAAKITAARAARMSEEANAAVATAHGAVLPIRMIAQDGIQRDLILTNKRKNVVVLVPILAKRKNFRDGYYKTVKFSVKMLIRFCISSSYSLDVKTSRGRARIFYASARKRAHRTRATAPRVTSSPTSSSCLVPSASWRLFKSCLERKNNMLGCERTTPASSFPSSGSI